MIVPEESVSGQHFLPARGIFIGEGRCYISYLSTVDKRRDEFGSDRLI